MATETFTPDAPAVPTAEQRLAELGLRLDPWVRYRVESLFPKVTGLGWKGAIKKKHALIACVEPTLRQALSPHETVLFVSKGVQHSFVEQYFMGIWAQTINQTVFVLTSARLLMLRTNSKGVPKQTFWSIYYSQIEAFNPSWTGVLQLRLRDGKKLKFTGFPKPDRRAMPELFQTALQEFRKVGFDPQVTQSMENLCSHCFNRVPKGEYACGPCGTEFWTPTAVALRSLIVPSWGDICLKHYVLACVEMAGFLFAWFVAIGAILSGLNNGEWVGGLLFAAVVLIFTHGADAALTYAMAKKGLHPRRRSLVTTTDSAAFEAATA